MLKRLIQDRRRKSLAVQIKHMIEKLRELEDKGTVDREKIEKLENEAATAKEKFTNLETEAKSEREKNMVLENQSKADKDKINMLERLLEESKKRCLRIPSMNCCKGKEKRKPNALYVIESDVNDNEVVEPNFLVTDKSIDIDLHKSILDTDTNESIEINIKDVTLSSELLGNEQNDFFENLKDELTPQNKILVLNNVDHTPNKKVQFDENVNENNKKNRNSEKGR